jgi:hypothetical protein
MKRTYETEAAQIAEAIRNLAANPSSLDNLESYLSYHFGEWLTKWASTPEDMACEFKEFAKIY